MEGRGRGALNNFIKGAGFTEIGGGGEQGSGLSHFRFMKFMMESLEAFFPPAAFCCFCTK